MKVVLELQDQPSNIKKVTVRHDIVIGRGAECNLRLSAPQVSRRHCFLRVSNDSATITDLDSSNGTYLNGKRITSGKRYELKEETQLAIGPVTFVARVVSEIPAGDLLEVKVNDERIESESSVIPERPFDDSTAGTNEDATVADLLPESDDDSMNFAIESGGPAADEDDPTADYVSTDGLGDGDFFSTAAADESGSSPNPSPRGKKTPDEQPSETGHSDDPQLSEDALVVAEIIESDSIEVLDVIKDVEIVDDDEVVLSDEEEVFVIEDDAVIAEDDDEQATVAVEDDEILVVDDEALVVDDDVENADEDEPRATSSDKLEDELRDFLSGLD